jgi:hypothetical protein
MTHEVRKVWLVQAVNDRADIAAGGSPLIGPYFWIPVNHVEGFEAWLRSERSYFGPNRAMRIFSESMTSQVPGNPATMAACIEEAKQFLADPKNWADPG